MPTPLLIARAVVVSSLAEKELKWHFDVEPL